MSSILAGRTSLRLRFALGYGWHASLRSDTLNTMDGCSNLVDGAWTNVAGAGPRQGTGGTDSMRDTNLPTKGPVYRLRVAMPGAE